MLQLDALGLSPMETAPALNVAALRAARERIGLSQNQLARLAGLAGGDRISKWERGEARPRSPRALHAVAQALDVEAIDLLLLPESGPNLRWWRFVAGLSVTELAAGTNHSVSTVKRWEAEGLKTPSDALLRVLASKLAATTEQVRRALRA